MVSEIELIEKAKLGDNNAITELVKMHSPKIYNLGLKMMRNPVDAEDVLQETFIKMLAKIHTFEGRSSLYTWLYRIATNVSLEKLSDKYNKNVYASLDDPEYYENGHVEPYEIPEYFEEKMSDETFKKYLDMAIEGLNEKHRAVFVLRDIEGMNVEETAQILNLSVSNVKVRLMRARLFLRDRLTEYFKSEELV
jgi:RNA polymerase sigma-70 factor (ECF subfamily)